jgi:hypothetical protein
MNIDEEIQAVEEDIRPLVEQLERLKRQRRLARSKAFIGVPFFGHVKGFADWLKETRCSKDWAEWNHRIYRTSDLIVGRFPNSTASIDDL